MRLPFHVKKRPAHFFTPLAKLLSTPGWQIGGLNRPVMIILTPNATIARHWTGALQASLRRSPLESFLRFRSLPVANRGPARDTDNLTHASMYILGKGLASYYRAFGRTLDDVQQALIGRMACQMCFGVAALIGEPQSWRVAALLSTTQQLSPQNTLLAAARRAAAAADEFTQHVGDASGDSGDIGALASAAIRSNSEPVVEQIAGLIHESLASRYDIPAASSSAARI